MTNSTLAVVAQSSFTATAKAANLFVATVYGRHAPPFRTITQAVIRMCTGSPVMLGFAKNAASAGGVVSVAVTGAMDGYTNLRPGACVHV